MSTSPFHRDDVPSAPTLNSIPSLPNMDSVPPLSYPYNVPSLPSQDSFPSLPNLNNVSSLPSQNSVPSLPQHPSMLLHSRMTSYSLLTAGDQDHASLININREAYAHFLCTVNGNINFKYQCAGKRPGLLKCTFPRAKHFYMTLYNKYFLPILKT